jgi:hypothetical protein
VSTDHDGPAKDHDDDSPTLRQRLHAATGDRDAEADALADASDDDVTPHDAKVAVQRSRGERGADEPTLDHDIATPGDAEAVAHEN